MIRRTTSSVFSTREEGGGKKIIAGYFALYNSVYRINDVMSESIAPGTFDTAIDGDIRALINHETTLVLGRTKAGTLKLTADEKGLYGEIEINENDTDALNLYYRVQRGDVDQCSFGFDIVKESFDEKDGKYHWTIKEIILYEVSPCTFPAYEETSIEARKSAIEAHSKENATRQKTILSDRLERLINA